MEKKKWITKTMTLERMNAKLLNVLDLYILFWELIKVQKCTEHTEQDAIYAFLFVYSVSIPLLL